MSSSELLLRYETPPREWKEGLPIGTGRLGCMVLGTYKRDRLALNHEWLWKGTNRNRENRKAAHLLPEVRRLLLAGEYEKGTKAANDAFGNYLGYRPDSEPRNRVDSYQPAGDLVVTLNHGTVFEYERLLDMQHGIVTVSYRARGADVRRTYVAHAELDAIIVRYEADNRALTGSISLERLFETSCRLTRRSGVETSRGNVCDGRLDLEGRFEGGTAFAVRADCHVEDGEFSEGPEGTLTCSSASSLTVVVDIGTDAVYGSPEEELSTHPLPSAGEIAASWDAYLESHRSSFAEALSGFSLEIDPAPRIDRESPDPTTPVDRRIAAVRAGGDDPGLILTYFNYARYLLCASSICGTLPANLQGKWNEDLNPPWESDYHHDINLQMTYWIAEPTGLVSCTEALLAHIERFVPHGRRAAADLYGCRGVWMPIQTDAWGRATPESYGWAVWIGAAPWLAQHMWWRWQYGRDLDQLRNRVYPFLVEVARFYEDYLVEDEAGTLQIVPSQSPENRFAGTGDFPVSIGISAAMDVELAWDVLTHAVEAAEILDVDEDDRRRWESMRSALPELGIGSDGRLLEWDREFEEVEPGHRHISHLFGLYPGDQIDPDRTPDLFAAAERSLEYRLSHQGGHTGWSRAWTACCFARLGRGEEAYEHLSRLVTDFATDSLLDLHPPGLFQIEGNMGGAAAVVEMLLQSRNEELRFLPAVPAVWSAGHVRGLHARGGYRIDIRWEACAVVEATVMCSVSRTCRINRSGGPYGVWDESGGRIPTTDGGVCIEFEVEAERPYTVKPAGESAR